MKRDTANSVRRTLIAAAPAWWLGLCAVSGRAAARIPEVDGAPPSIVGLLAQSASPARLPMEAVAKALASNDWVLMMRHERTVPGVGDPPQFRLGECATQRNLSDEGRERARRAGQLMREAGIRLSRVLAGRWCRVEDTARLAFGEFESWPALDSFFAQSERGPSQRAQVLDWLARNTHTGNIMLVTHQVNISGLLEVYPEQGEVIAARREGTGLRPVLRWVPADVKA